MDKNSKHHPELLDLTNTISNGLKVIKESSSKIRYNKGKAYNVRTWICACLSCGKEIIKDQASLRSGKNKSCGCLHKTICFEYWKTKKRSTGKDHSRWSGFKEMSGRYWGNLVSSAKHRNISFELSKEEVYLLFEKQNKLCNLSGLPISFIDNTASLDRIDSSKSYELNNVQWVHKDINKMKMSLKQDDFINFCIKVSNKVGIQ